MKIGAGALQSMIVHDALPQRSTADSQARMTQAMNHQMGLAGAVINRHQLLRALERLNKEAKLYHLSDEFLMKEEGGVLFVALVDRNTGEIKRKLPAERFLAGEGYTNSGAMLDIRG